MFYSIAKKKKIYIASQLPLVIKHGLNKVERYVMHYCFDYIFACQ